MKALKYVTTDLTEKQIRSLLTSVITMGATEVEQFRIPYEGSYTEGRLSGNGAWVMQVDYEANKKALQYFVFGIGEDPGINDSYGVGNDKFIKGSGEDGGYLYILIYVSGGKYYETDCFISFSR